MADSTTTYLGLTQPEVGASTDTWGTKLNTDLATIDALFTTGPVLLLANGGTGAGTAAGARTNLGCGTMATQNAGAIAVTGGTAAGVTVDSSPIGQTTPAAGKFTSLQFTGILTFPDATTQITASTSYTAGVQSLTANTTLTLSYQEHLVKADATGGSFTVTLFTAAGNTGKRVTVKKMDSTSNTVTLACSGGQTIDGAATQAIYRLYDAVTLISDGSNWLIT